VRILSHGDLYRECAGDTAGGEGGTVSHMTSLRGALATKQSILSLRGEMDCFASLAMTGLARN
jgi:hypothetical protein